ncbi:B3 domain-containing transcription factor FUS3 isoform X2 [Cryptomeria japonica]|uniref:B3 domain-containing transcription factor FUS3 isoform X2 n=1 Tax=Cryptomeria japonica TaxID=3369 RepID=UPI0027DA9A19|nr:B3 domain-containing transcription factor FUS3 isoform X2 [Cryptomeria japonica]
MGERDSNQNWMSSNHCFDSDKNWSLAPSLQQSHSSPLVWNNTLSSADGRLFHSFPEYNSLSRSASGSQLNSLNNVPNQGMPLSSSSTGDLPSLHMKEEENAVASCFTNKLPLNSHIGGVTATLQSAASVRANRKRRMARHRRVSNMTMEINLQQTSPQQSHSMANLEESQSTVQRHKPRGRGYIDNNVDQKVNDQEMVKKDLKFLLQKELRNSDVGSLGRIVLPKKEAEAHLPTLTAREGMVLSMEETDGTKTWNFKYRFWPNNKSRMYILENTGEFVKTHELTRGDFIMMYRDAARGKYVIRGKKAGNSQESSGNSGERNIICPSSNAIEDGNSNVKSVNDNGNEVNSNVNNMSQPTVEIAYMGSAVEDIFPKDFSIDFATGIPNSPKLESIPSFGSDEMSIEDFWNN